MTDAQRTSENQLRPVLERSRPTICDGEVFTYALRFDESEDSIIGGKFHDAKGPFEISASRNAVCVHNAELKSDSDVCAFLEALEKAKQTARRLTREGWGGSYRRDGDA